MPSARPGAPEARQGLQVGSVSKTAGALRTLAKTCSGQGLRFGGRQGGLLRERACLWEAVKEDGGCLVHAHEDMKQDRAFVLEAVCPVMCLGFCRRSSNLERAPSAARNGGSLTALGPRAPRTWQAIATL